MTRHWLVQSAIGVAAVASLSFGARAASGIEIPPTQDPQTKECSAGYIPGPDGACVDVDECRYNNGECDERVTCTNTPGSRTCSACPTDFVGDGYFGCTDINDCASIPGGCKKVDNKPPAIRTSGGKTVPATSDAGAVVTYTAWSVDNVDGALAVTCKPLSGSTFAVGATTVTCNAEDKAGNKKTQTITINVTK
jgi:hypothetical protein